MNIQKTVITPLNCGYSTGPNGFVRVEESEYSSDTVRSVYVRDVDESWFKMKSGSATPYLEPTFFGLVAGDVITLTFDALLLSGESDVLVHFYQLTTTTGPSLTHKLPQKSLKAHYEKFKISCVVDHRISGGLGILLNIRPTGLNSEIIVKNLEIEIKTKNNKFSLDTEIVKYDDQTDFVNMIKNIATTDVRPSYNSLYNTIFKGGFVSFPDSKTMEFLSGGPSGFRGACALFSGSPYKNSTVFYAEIDNKSADSIFVTTNEYPENFSSSSSSSSGAIVSGNTSGIKKKIIFTSPSATGSKKTFADIGRTIDQNVSYKKIRICKVRFDDAPKSEPNDVRQLRTDFGDILAGLSNSDVWLSATFQNSWGGTLQYKQIGNLLVVRGRVSGGTINLPVMTLPSSIRPRVATVRTAQGTATGSSRVTVATSGTITIEAAVSGATGYDLDFIIPL